MKHHRVIKFYGVTPPAPHRRAVLVASVGRSMARSLLLCIFHFSRRSGRRGRRPWREPRVRTGRLRKRRPAGRRRASHKGRRRVLRLPAFPARVRLVRRPWQALSFGAACLRHRAGLCAVLGSPPSEEARNFTATRPPSSFWRLILLIQQPRVLRKQCSKVKYLQVREKLISPPATWCA